MPGDATYQTALTLMSEGGALRQPIDSGLQGMFRPGLTGETRDPREQRVSSLESYYSFYLNNIDDPDDAYRLNPNIPQIIRQHPDVQADIRKRAITVAGFPDSWDPNPDAKDQHAAKEIAQYVEWAWKQVNDRQHLYEMLQTHAILEGGVGTEFRWHREITGTVRPIEWFPVHKTRFVFDRMGNMALRTRGAPIWGAYVDMAPGSRPPEPDEKQLISASRFPAGKWMYHVHRRGLGRWSVPEEEGYWYYGIGEDVALFYPVTFDIFCLRMRMKWLEKYGMPPVRMYYSESRVFKEEWRKVATSLRGESLAGIPKGAGKDGKELHYTIEDVPVPTMSYDAFERFSDGYTKKRVSAILLGSADETQRSEHGGYSDQVARREGGPDIWFAWDATNISASIQKCLAPAIARGRYPNLPAEYVPIHRLTAKEEKDRDAEVGIIDKASKLISVPVEYVYESTGIPRPQPGEETIGGPQQQPAPGAMPGQEGQPPQGQPQGQQQPVGVGIEGGAGANAQQAPGERGGPG